ncbi:diguanylate cyclase [Paraglaciecola sp. T6c]|uniref:tetratricopeptide repeat-containing diguanylate cyclase n=1 Tax=Pseudoalteromonas atlantica (strain T6c / ATCC BAA-1087) TaxID=3042615 RepID=UPI00005C53FF|nr:diguanylate cyclase [Paraglaciecola sp. T6c]ABG40827.1 diguanylate cyclase [Paraglaciecola sp. T6c]
MDWRKPIARRNAVFLCALLCHGNVIAQVGVNPFQVDHIPTYTEINPLKRAIELARKQGEMNKAEALTEQFQQLAVSKNDALALADVYFEQARNTMERNHYAPAHDLLNKAINVYQEQGDQAGLAKAYRQRGLTYRYQSNYPQALEYIYSAMQISQQQNDTSAVASTYNSIGLVLEKMGLLEGAAQAHQSALEMHHELDDKNGIASALYNLGDLRRLMGDDKLALTYFQDALKIDLASEEKKYIAYSHNKVGFQFIQLADYEQARYHLTEALTLFQQIQAPRDTDWAILSMATLEMNLGNLPLSRTMLDGVIERAIDKQYKSLLVDAYRTSAQLALLDEDTELALQHIDAGVTQAKKNNESHDEALLEALRVKAYLQEDALRQALDALLYQKKLDDEILNTTRIKTIATLQSQTEFVRRAQQIKLLEKEQALTQVTLKQAQWSRNVWLASIVVSAILFALVYGRISQRRLNKRLSEEVAIRTLELSQKNVELQAAYREMEAISLTDKLTGINNRRFLENHIETDLEKSQRIYDDWRDGKTPTPHQGDIVVFMIDMDHFKRVNDEHGHHVGDEVLRQLTKRLARVFRQSDYLVRWGGEEFVGIARFIDRSDAPLLAQRLLDEVSASPFRLSDKALSHYTCSIGYVCYPPILEHSQQTDWKTLIALADGCLYQAKKSGRNAWVGIEKVHQPTLDLIELCSQYFEDSAPTNKITVLTSQKSH